jgi:hypothetical protein
MLRDAGASNLPPPDLLEALRQPRRPQLGDPCVKAPLVRWKRLGLPIEYVDLNRVADVLGVTRPDAKTRRKIVAAVEAAGIEIYDLRKGLADTFAHVQLTGDGKLAIVEQSRWCEPEEWDARRSQPRAPAPVSSWLQELHLDSEYGPTLERFTSQEKRRQGAPLWFLFPRESGLGTTDAMG